MKLLRRNNTRGMEYIERLIHKAVGKIEAMECSTLLTDAQVLLMQAKDKVSDHLEAKGYEQKYMEDNTYKVLNYINNEIISDLNLSDSCDLLKSLSKHGYISFDVMHSGSIITSEFIEDPETKEWTYHPTHGHSDDED